MSTTLTVRTGQELRAALVRRATAQRKTLSQVAREILEEALAERPIEARASHLRGSLRLKPSSATDWRGRLRERNWRP